MYTHEIRRCGFPLCSQSGRTPRYLAGGAATGMSRQMMTDTGDVSLVAQRRFGGVGKEETGRSAGGCRCRSCSTLRSCLAAAAARFLPISFVWVDSACLVFGVDLCELVLHYIQEIMHQRQGADLPWCIVGLGADLGASLPMLRSRCEFVDDCRDYGDAHHGVGNNGKTGVPVVSSSQDLQQSALIVFGCCCALSDHTRYGNRFGNTL
ncbi:hypothetical protein FQR65_LT07392 [Abscondita terminalis]|nr:hypothetical protein FQR65_LT07392 [Abscondita terminalis]